MQPNAPITSSATDDRDFDRVASFFAGLDKVIRAARLYQGEGALLGRLMEDLERRGLDLVSDGAVTVRVASFGVVYQGHPVAPDDKRIPYLFRLFCDGVRELTLLPGFDRDEMKALVEVLATDLRGADDDLVTLLWRQQFKSIRYYAADTFAAGLEVGMDGDLTLASSQGPGQLASEADGQEIALSPDDIRLLAGEGHLEWIQEVSAPREASGKVAQVAERIRASFQRPDDIERFVSLGLEHAHRTETGTEPSALVVGMLDDLAAQGRGATLASAFAVLLQAEGATREAADAVFGALCSPARLTRLAGVMGRDPEPFLTSIEPLVGRLGAALVPLLKDLPAGPVQEKLHTSLSAAGHDLTLFYAEQLDSPEEAVVIHAIDALGQVGTADAMLAVSRVLSVNSIELRRAALRAFKGHYHPEARIAVARALRDPDRQNRLLALEVIAGAADNRMTWGLLAAVKEPRFTEKDEEEQAAHYRALASFLDDRSIEHFKEILSRKNLTRAKGVVTAQLLAVGALADVGSPKAVETLQGFKGAFYHPAAVKQAIERALSSRRGGAS
ncbi:MAG: hypothetical protein ABIO70_31875 [Pseudomonadota bacterium]